MPIKFLNDVAVDSSVLYVDTINDEVGINTINPLAKLQVNTGSDINAQLGLDSFGSFKLGDVSNNYTGRGVFYSGTSGSEDLQVLTNTFRISGGLGEGIQRVANGDVYLNSQSGVLATLDASTNNFGIGTTTPITKLEINGPNHDANFTSGCLMIKQASTGSRIFIDGNDIDSADGILFLNDYSLNEVRLGGNLTAPNGKVSIGTTTISETFTLQTRATGLGSEGIFIKNPFAGTSPVVNSNSPFLSLATSTTSAYNSTIYMGRNATATDQESKIEWSNANDALSIYVKGQGSYREHVRFGDISLGTPRTSFGGNVGIGTIGTTTPSGKLEVRQAANNGDTGAFTNTHVKLTASATADNTGFVGITAATSTADNYGYSFGAQRSAGGIGDFKINYHENSAAGVNRFIIDLSGRVGIGTTTLAHDLNIGQLSDTETSAGIFSNNQSRLFLTTQTNATASCGLHFGDSQFANVNTRGKIEYNANVSPSQNYFQFRVNFSDAMRLGLNSSGAVRAGIGTTTPNSMLQVNGGVQLANDTDTASASKVGTFRYYTSGNNSYVDMCMQTGAATYAWVNIVQNTW